MTADLFDRLAPCLAAPGPGQHRLFHGRGGSEPELEWLTLDLYPPILFATFFRQPPAGFTQQLTQKVGELTGALGTDVLLCQHRYLTGAPIEVLLGELPEVPVAQEGGLRYLLDFSRGQNVGFFGDMSNGRQWLRERSAGKKVLNLFAFTCSFSVAAIDGGAESVVNIDMSKPALSLGQRNHALNDQDISRVRFLPHDIFRSWKKLHSLGRYDLIVIDPPSNQKGSFVAKRDYRKLVRKLHKLLQPQADILACLNAPFLEEAWLDETVLENLPGTEKVERLPPAPGFEEPGEGALKVIHYRYRRPEPLD